MKEMKTLKLPGQSEAYEIVDAKARELIGSHTHDEYDPAVFEFITIEDIDAICGLSVINFTINGTAFQCSNGMTWYDFAHSEYNTDGSVNCDDYVVYYGDAPVGTATGVFGFENVSPEETIIENTDYTAEESDGW